VRCSQSGGWRSCAEALPGGQDVVLVVVIVLQSSEAATRFSRDRELRANRHSGDDNADMMFRRISRPAFAICRWNGLDPIYPPLSYGSRGIARNTCFANAG
jgi:hypothetical protein